MPGPEVLRVLSDGARVHSAFWNVNAYSTFSDAVYGKVLTSFDGTSPYYRHGTDPDVLNPDLADVFEASPDTDTRPSGAWTAAMLATIERRTAVRLDSEWIRRPQRCLTLAELPSDPQPPGGGVDPDLDAAYRLATAPTRRAARVWLLRRLAADFGLDGEPGVADSIATVAAGLDLAAEQQRVVSEVVDRLTRVPSDPPLSRAKGPRPEFDPAYRRLHAGGALTRMLGVNPYPEPFPELRGLLNAQHAYGERWPEVRMQMRQLLR